MIFKLRFLKHILHRVRICTPVGKPSSERKLNSGALKWSQHDKWNPLIMIHRGVADPGRTCRNLVPILNSFKNCADLSPSTNLNLSSSKHFQEFTWHCLRTTKQMHRIPYRFQGVDFPVGKWHIIDSANAGLLQIFTWGASLVGGKSSHVWS